MARTNNWWKVRKEERKDYKKEIRKQLLEFQWRNKKNCIVRLLLSLVFSCAIVGVFWYLMQL